MTSILADTFLFWAVKVRNRRNILVVSFWVMSAAVVSMFHHFDLLVQNCHHSIDVSGVCKLSNGEETLNQSFLFFIFLKKQFFFSIFLFLYYIKKLFF